MANKNLFGTDLKLDFQDYWVNVLVTRSGDLETISGLQNLCQAIRLRLTTERGELSELGHPEYGSRLFELYGKPNNERTRDEVKKMVIECLNQEPRIRHILGVITRRLPNVPNTVEVEISLLPSEGKELLNIVYPFNLEVG